MRLIATLLLFASFIAGFGGLLFLSEATAGVGIIGFGCFLAILSRLFQAQANHKDLTQTLRRLHQTARPVIAYYPAESEVVDPRKHI